MITPRPLLVALLAGALCLSAACKDAPAPETTPTPNATPPVEAPVTPPAAEVTPTPAPDTAGLDAKIEQLTETCAKLDSPASDSCKMFVVQLEAKDADALTHVDAVIEGITVEGNMVMLDPKVEQMLTDKYKPAE